MVTFEVSTTINQPVDIVVTALMNPDNFTYWTTDLEKFEVIKGKPGEIGSIGHLHYMQKGKSYVMEDKLIYSDPGKKYVSQVTGDALTATVETTLHTMDNKTQMNIKWSGKGNILILKLLLPFLRHNMIKQSRKELEIFKGLVEAKGIDFSK
jgi:hypothetical protein